MPLAIHFYARVITEYNMPPKKDKKDATVLNEEAEMNTTRILEAMEKMKTDILVGRAIKDEEILIKITSIDTKLTHSIDGNSARLESLELNNVVVDRSIETLTLKQEQLSEECKELREKLLASVSHSRRLNLDFLGFIDKDSTEKEVLPKIRDFLVNVLGIEQGVVNAMLIRDGHRIGKFDIKRARPRVIKVGFIRMEDRDLIYGLAYKCKNSDFAISVDLPPELALIRKANVDIRKLILAANPTALASCTYRSYRPILLVKFEGRVQEFSDELMRDKFAELEPGDRRFNRR